MNYRSYHFEFDWCLAYRLPVNKVIKSKWTIYQFVCNIWIKNKEKGEIFSLCDKYHGFDLTCTIIRWYFWWNWLKRIAFINTSNSLTTFIKHLTHLNIYRNEHNIYKTNHNFNLITKIEQWFDSFITFPFPIWILLFSLRSSVRGVVLGAISLRFRSISSFCFCWYRIWNEFKN